MFREILIASRKSPFIKDAIRYSANLFQDSRYHLLNVVDITGLLKYKVMEEQLKMEGQEKAKNERKLLREIDIDIGICDVVVGELDTEVLTFSRSHDIDLLLLVPKEKPTRENPQLDKGLRSILERTSLPTLLISSEVEPSLPDVIFHPTSGDEYSMEATSLALNLCEKFDAVLDVLCINPEKKEKVFKKVEEQAEKMGIEVRLDSAPEKAERKVMSRCREDDLLICSRGREGFLYELSKLFPSLALTDLQRKTMIESEIPLLLVGD